MDVTNTIDEQQLRKLSEQLDSLADALEAIKPDNSTTRQVRYIADGIAAALGGRG